MAGNKLKLLIVEDEAEFAESLSELVSNEPTVGEVVVAPDYTSAARMLTQSDFDVVVTDYHLPGERDGIHLVNEFSGLNPETRFIVMTGDPRSVIQSISKFDSAAFAFLPKPFTIKEFQALLVSKNKTS